MTARIRQLVLCVATLSLAAVLLPTLASATPTPATPPTVATVTAQLRTIAQQNEAISEQLNLVIADVASKQHAAQTAEDFATAAIAQYATQRGLLTHALTAQYEGASSFSRTGALLSSNSGQNYVDRLNTLNMMSMHQGDLVTQVATAQRAAAAAQGTANVLLAAATTKRDNLKQQQAGLSADQAKYETLLATLNVEQRAAYQNVGVPVVAVNTAALMVHAGPAAAQSAVNFALAQVGKPYVYDAAGPNSWDCSGLTMAAYAAGGVSLPHNAAGQFGYGTHVAESSLQAGDLVFFYRPIGHVAIYIGNGLMVSAPEPGENVRVVTLASQQDAFTGATRLS